MTFRTLAVAATISLAMALTMGCGGDDQPENEPITTEASAPDDAAPASVDTELAEAAENGEPMAPPGEAGGSGDPPPELPETLETGEIVVPEGGIVCRDPSGMVFVLRPGQADPAFLERVALQAPPQSTQYQIDPAFTADAHVTMSRELAEAMGSEPMTDEQAEEYRQNAVDATVPPHAFFVTDLSQDALIEWIQGSLTGWEAYRQMAADGRTEIIQCLSEAHDGIMVHAFATEDDKMVLRALDVQWLEEMRRRMGEGASPAPETTEPGTMEG
jgi:hypothetical protein